MKGSELHNAGKKKLIKRASKKMTTDHRKEMDGSVRSETLTRVVRVRNIKGLGEKPVQRRKRLLITISRITFQRVNEGRCTGRVPDFILLRHGRSLAQMSLIREATRKINSIKRRK
jgi:hypothetical protein